MDADRIAVLNVCIEAGIPVLLWGEPGTAKSSIVESTCRSLERACEVVIASLRDPADFGGLPVVRPDGVVMHAPAWAQRLAKVQRGVLFLDEVNQSAPAVQAALMRVVLDRVVGDLALPADIAIIAAANPPNVGASAYELAHPFANRFLHLPWTHDLSVWAQGMLAGFPDSPARRLPADWKKHLPEIKAFIVGFLRKNPSLAQQLPRADQEVRAYPTLRSWHMMAANGLAAARALGYGLDTQVAHLILTGAIGDGAAVAFLQYARSMDLPDPEEAIKDPDGYTLPKRDDAQSVFAAALCAAAIQPDPKRDEAAQHKRFSAAWKAMCRLKPDIAYLSARQLLENRSKKFPVPPMGPFRELMSQTGLV